MASPAQLNPGAGIGAKAQGCPVRRGFALAQIIVQAHFGLLVIALLVDHHALEQAGADQCFALLVQALAGVVLTGLDDCQAVDQAG